MSRSLIASLLRRRVPEPPDAGSDAVLLDRYTHTGDQAAFELLVWRHAAMVAGVCRRVVRDEHLAEDAFQAVFLVLARNADSVRGTNLAGWLFRVARRVSARARRQASIRTARETPLVSEPLTVPEPSRLEQRESFALLDEEVARLPERFRLPVLLCYLGGRTTDEAARLLGCPRGTVLSRLATARQRLAVRLTRRGVALAVPVVWAGVISDPSFARLVADTIRRSTEFLVRRSGANRPASFLLAEGVLRTMHVGKLMVAAGVVLVAGLAIGFGTLTAQPRPGESAGNAAPPPPPPGGASASPATKGQPPAPKPEDIEAERIAREVRFRRLVDYRDDLRAELEAKEKALALLEDANNTTGVRNLVAPGKLQMIEQEMMRQEIEILRIRAELAPLKKLLAAGAVVVSDQEVQRAVELDYRVQTKVQQHTALVDVVARMRANMAPDAPTLRAKETELAIREKELADTRAKVQTDVKEQLLLAAKQRLRARIDELELKLDVACTLVEELGSRSIAYRRDIESAGRPKVKAEELRQSLIPAREQLVEIERELLRLRLSREGVVLNVPGSTATEAKLDAVLKELQELRREVRDLRKQ